MLGSEAELETQLPSARLLPDHCGLTRTPCVGPRARPAIPPQAEPGGLPAHAHRRRPAPRHLWRRGQTLQRGGVHDRAAPGAAAGRADQRPGLLLRALCRVRCACVGWDGRWGWEGVEPCQEASASPVAAGDAHLLAKAHPREGMIAQRCPHLRSAAALRRLPDQLQPTCWHASCVPRAPRSPAHPGGQRHLAALHHPLPAARHVCALPPLPGAAKGPSRVLWGQR